VPALLARMASRSSWRAAKVITKGDPSFVYLAFGGDFLSKKPTNPLERRRIVRWYALRRDLTRRLTLRSKTVAGTPQRISGAWIAGGILREAQGTP